MDLSEKAVRKLTQNNIACRRYLGENLKERRKCHFCGGQDQNRQFKGHDPDLTGKWFCKPCYPCSKCGNYNDDAACIGPDSTGNRYCSNCLEEDSRPRCAVCGTTFATSDNARRHKKESTTCGTRKTPRTLCPVSGCRKSFGRNSNLKRHLLVGHGGEGYTADENSTRDFSAASVTDPMDNTIQAEATKTRFNSAKLGEYEGREVIAGDHLGVVYNQNSARYSDEVLLEMGQDKDPTYTSDWEDWRPLKDSQSQIDVFKQMQSTNGLSHTTRAYTIAMPSIEQDVPPCSLCGEYEGNALYIGLSSEHTGNWYCMPCRPCSICGDSEGNHIFCDKCDGAYHFSCAGIDTAPDEDELWYCIYCLGGAFISPFDETLLYSHCIAHPPPLEDFDMISSLNAKGSLEEEDYDPYLDVALDKSSTYTDSFGSTGKLPYFTDADFSPNLREQKLRTNSELSHTNRDWTFDHGTGNNASSNDSEITHPLFNATPKADGLYHCPFENDPTVNCTHKPQKLKCNYDKLVHAHLKLNKCKVKGCKEPHFSSRACLLRHEREAHGMHGHGNKPFLCTFQDCERAILGNGFPRSWNREDHEKRVHRQRTGKQANAMVGDGRAKPRKAGISYDVI